MNRRPSLRHMPLTTRSRIHASMAAGRVGGVAANANTSPCTRLRRSRLNRWDLPEPGPPTTNSTRLAPCRAPRHICLAACGPHSGSPTPWVGRVWRRRSCRALSEPAVCPRRRTRRRGPAKRLGSLQFTVTRARSRSSRPRHPCGRRGHSRRDVRGCVRPSSGGPAGRRGCRRVRDGADSPGVRARRGPVHRASHVLG